MQWVQGRTEAGISHGDELWIVDKHDKHGPLCNITLHVWPHIALRYQVPGCFDARM